MPPSRSRPRRGSGAGVATLLAVVVLGGAGWVWWQGHVAGVPVREVCTATAAGSSTTLSPEQAGNAATISTIAVRRGLPARAATIGLATAMQESKLRNLDYGDRDSLGLFQQRPSQGWGTPEQVRDPVYSANAFYDVLVKIDGYEDGVITDVAQAVQRSAFPQAYAQHEPEARILASTLSGYSPAAFECVLRPVPEGAEEVGADGWTPRAADVIAAARAEAGRAASGPVPGTAGTGVRFTLSGAEADRLGWSLAQWAVARAGGLDVVEVRTGGQRWQRDEPGSGWTAVDGVPAGTVEVLVAGAVT